MKFRLFRGIGVAESDKGRCEESLRAGILRADRPDWRFWHQRHSDPLAMAKRSKLSRADTQVSDLEKDGVPASFACGDQSGAAHYAWRAARPGSGNVPLIVEFEVDVSQVAVDGRDSLYTLINRVRDQAVQSEIECVWGIEIRPYLELAKQRPADAQYNFALVDLASVDQDVILAHHRNTKPVAGRFGTKFCSAFVVPERVAQEAVRRIWTPHEVPDFDDANGVLDVYRLGRSQ